MGLKNKVFGSVSEERGFRSIERSWGNDYRLFPQLPFSALFEPDDTIHDTSNFFFKTSIDYTLCTKAGNPLLAIDFDGMGHGFNKNGEYVKVRETTDRYRKIKFDFKIRYAERYNFPYHIISYDEIEPIGEDLNLTIVDGVIGYTVARMDFKQKIQESVRHEAHIIDSLPPYERQEYIQGLVTDQEILSKFEHDPIVKRTLQVGSELLKQGCSPLKTWWHLFQPDLPELEYDPPGSWSVPTPSSFNARVAAMDEASRVGCLCTLTSCVGEVSETAWMRTVGNFSQTMVITKNMAELLAHAKLLRMASQP